MKKILTILSLSLVLSVLAQPTLPSTSGDSSSDGASSGGGQSSVSKVPTSLPFLSSRAALRTHAAESARNAYVEFTSPGMQYGASWGTGWEGITSLEAIADDIDDMNVEFPMVNVVDTVKAEAKITNTEGEDLFLATSWRTPEQEDDDGEYVLPQFYFGFRLADLIPIKLDKSIRWAQVKYLAEDGRTIVTVDVEVRNGKMYYPEKFAGKSMLVLHDDKGKAHVYNRKGLHVPTENVEWSGAQSYFDGLYSFQNPSNIDVQVWSWNGQGQNPAFEVTMTSSRSVNCRVYSNEGAVATGFYVRHQGRANWTFYPVVSPATYASIPLDSGASYVVPEWNTDEFKESEPYIEGKGGLIELPGKG